MSATDPQMAIGLAPEDWPQTGQDTVGRAQRGLLGRQISRLDGPLKVVGDARFSGEYVMEGMVYAALHYSTIARGRIATLDTSRRRGRRRGRCSS